MKVIQWHCPACFEINSDKASKRKIVCGACGRKFSAKDLKKTDYAEIVELDKIIAKKQA